MRAVAAPAAVRTDTLGHWLSEVAKAAGLFECRWTRRALERVDGSLATRLRAQKADFDRATVTGDLSDIEVQGAATVRGYLVCVRAMEAASEPDDAYVIGSDTATGYRVAIGNQRAAAARVAEIHGSKVAWYSADEIAALLARMEGLKTLSAIKTIWPGSEILDMYPDKPAKADGDAA